MAGARKLPISVNGAFPVLNGPFSDLNGPFSPNALMGRFPSWKSPGKQPIKKRGVKRFLTIRGFQRGVFVRGEDLNNWGGARTGCNN